MNGELKMSLQSKDKYTRNRYQNYQKRVDSSIASLKTDGLIAEYEKLFKRYYYLEGQIKELEAEISNLENKISGMRRDINNPSIYPRPGKHDITEKLVYELGHETHSVASELRTELYRAEQKIKELERKKEEKLQQLRALQAEYNELKPYIDEAKSVRLIVKSVDNDEDLKPRR